MMTASTFLTAFVVTIHFINAATIPLECELYIAESTIPNARLGVFSAVEKQIGDKIGNGDPSFPLLRLTWNNEQTPRDENRSLVDPFEDYVWDGFRMGMGNEVEEGGMVTTLWPGLDCIVNSHMPLQNLGHTFPQHNSHGDYLPYMPHRGRDPAAGAITTYRSAQTLVKKHVPPGGELFKSYGDQWFLGRANIFPKGFPLRKNFPQAQALLQKYHALSDFQLLHQLLLDLRTIWNESRTLNALPSTLEELQLALEHDLTYIYQKNATRDVKWLQEHGTCIDHIVHRPSTIQGAGEGAFAKRTLPKGTIITGSPLLTIPSEGFLDMYDDETTEDDDDEEEDNQYRAPFTKQILYNYCLGHPESTLLFFPYAAVGVQYINHNSSLANVKIQWANHGKLRHNARLLKLSSEEIYSSVWNPSLGIEYVALTDIAEGEELFLDYGEEWNTAWTRHVETWMPPNEDTIAADWNEKNEYIPIKEEESDHSNQPNIELRCHAFLLQDDWESKNYPWKRYGNFRQKHLDVYGVPCVVLERNISNDTYTVEVSRDYLTYIPIPEGMDEGTLIRRGVPRDALFFLDVPYESDLYLESAFRHVITMPDHMIPLTWRNKPKADTGRSARHEEL